VSHIKLTPRQIAILLVAHVAVTAVTWRDLARRTDDEVRGSRRVWRVASALQMGNSLVYWLFARKQPA
jgi:hypothetical protein